MATYLAHQGLLSENPSILNSEDGLDEKIVDLAGDEKLVQNLAAMVFNVEVNLAFQILLDEEIAKAIVAEDADQLLDLSDAPGFGLRVDDVVRENAEEWRSTGEFGTAVGNISTLLKSYKGDARIHLASSVLETFYLVDMLSIDDDEYQSFLPLFEIAGDQSFSDSINHFVEAVFKGIHQQENHGFKDGQNLVAVLQQLKETISPLGAEGALLSAVGRQSPPSTSEYMLSLIHI